MEGIVITQTIAVALLSLVGFMISFWVILSDKKSLVNIFLFGLINFSILFIISDQISVFTSGSLTTYLLRFTYAFAIVAVAFFYLFVKYFPIKSKDFTSIDIFIITSSIFLSLFTLFSNAVVYSATVQDYSTLIRPGDWISFYYIALLVILTVTIFTLGRNYLASNRDNRLKIKLLLSGIFTFITFEIVFNIILPLFSVSDLYFFGDYAIIFFFVLAAYSIVKHKLFDVRLAIVRSVTYSLVLMTFAAIYFVMTYIFSTVFHDQISSPVQIITGAITSIIMAFAFQPLKKFFDRITNKIFYKDNYSTDDFYAKLNSALTQTTEIRNLLTRVSYVISDTFKSEQAFFFVYTNADGHYLMAGTDGHNHLPKHDAIIVEQEFNGKNDIVVESMLKDGDRIKRMMISHKIGLILPLIQDASVVGYLCLGEHKTSRYTNRDIKVLYTISNELIIAIQNALAVEEIREINRTLQQRIANATRELRSNNRILRQLDKVKDEFISMASHQLRTPLTSVKGYISMVLEGDMGKISKSQEQVLEQAFQSSENMVHLINDFLNVSRIQSGKFVIEKNPVDLADLVQQEVNGLLPNAKARDMKLVYNKPKDFPTVGLDEGKIRQVVMNFSDNAIYYSRENTDININLTIENDEVVFTVKDHGIGVPKKARDQLFSKFFRADNAKVKRPDGTGVGLYLAKKVVDAHGGEIIFDSVEGQGSTFGFRIPLDKNESETSEEPKKPTAITVN